METTFWEGACQHGVCFGRGVLNAAQSMEAVGLEGREGQRDRGQHRQRGLWDWRGDSEW